MLLDRLTGFESVQFILIVGIFVCLIVYMCLRSVRQEGERKSQDQRQKDAIATQISVGRQVTKSQKADHASL